MLKVRLNVTTAKEFEITKAEIDSVTQITFELDDTIADKNQLFNLGYLYKPNQKAFIKTVDVQNAKESINAEGKALLALDPTVRPRLINQQDCFISKIV